MTDNERASERSPMTDETPRTSEEYAVELEIRQLERQRWRCMVNIGYFGMSALPYLAGLISKYTGLMHEEAADRVLFTLGTVSALMGAGTIGYTIGRVGEVVSQLRVRRELFSSCMEKKG